MSTQRKFVYNGIFDSITPTSSYILGLFASDGNVCAGERTSLHLKEEDRYLVQKVANLIGYIGELPPSQFAATNKELYKALNDRGIHERKSRTIDESVLPDIHLNAFIRGLFDGDGSIAKTNIKTRNKQKIIWNITGHKPFLEKVRSRIKEEVGIDLNICVQREEMDTWSLYTTKIENIYKLYEWLYKDAEDLFMIRKKKRFDEYVDYLKTYKKKKKYDIYINGRPMVNNKCMRCQIDFCHRADHANKFCSRLCCIEYYAEKKSEVSYAA